MTLKLRGRDFITLKDYSKGELETIFDLAFELKEKLKRGEPHQLLQGKEMGMLFFAKSTRTRISFETGMSQLGGHAQFYTLDDTQSAGDKETANVATKFGGESWSDMAKVMSRYLNGLAVRVNRNPQIPALADMRFGQCHAIMKNIAEAASIPVISAADDMEHPCQVMADIMTIIEKFGRNYRSKKVVIHWATAGKRARPGIPHSILMAAATLGMNLTIVYPGKGFDLDPDYMELSKKLAARSGASIEVTHDRAKAVKGADVIYAKPWAALSQSIENDSRLRLSLADWKVTEESFAKANKGAIFMNPMPLERGTTATDEVADGPRSVMFDEAENRLHVQKAIMSLVM